MPRPVVLRPPLEESDEPVPPVDLGPLPLEESLDEQLAPVRLFLDLACSRSLVNAKANYEFLVVECTKCHHSAELRLEAIRCPDEMSLDDLVCRLRCTRCGQKGPPMVKIRGVATHPDDSSPAVQMPPADDE